jgi:N-methylhydantoinase A
VTKVGAGVAAGVDVGGTFTDRAALLPDGRVEARKVLSTPADQGEGVVESLQGLSAPATRLVHGTTVVTNLLLERTGARVVLCATEGASDLLELRRQDRASLYDLAAQHPTPLVPPERVVAVKERITPAGVERALTAAEAKRVVRAALALEPEVVVIALLHAYADASHERALATAFAAARDDLPVVTSTDVLPEIREYERTTTAVAEGYARPRVEHYLRRLGDRLTRAKQPQSAVMTSGGGMLAARDAAGRAASLALSGPAGGVVGAAAVLRALGVRDALTIDIGGTSADAGLILDGEPLVEPGGEVGGVSIALSRVLVDTVSAGGGSIAWVDDGGALRVGPQSAGAVPGPAAFGRGGTAATVTDAQLVLGRIRATALSGGVSLETAAATRAIDALALTLGEARERVAAAIVRIADAEMARSLRRVSVERGVDPRDCALVAFGGGGPLHACALADVLEVPEIIVPPHAGVLSALGLALAPERHERARSVLQFAKALSAAALQELCDSVQVDGDASERRWFARMRFEGQGHELDVDVLPGERGDDLAARFAAAHRTRYGFDLAHRVEMVALRQVAGEPARQVQLARDPKAASFDRRSLTDAGGPAASAAVPGPAVIALPDATLWVADGWRADAMAIGGWRLTRQVTE